MACCQNIINAINLKSVYASNRGLYTYSIGLNYSAVHYYMTYGKLQITRRNSNVRCVLAKCYATKMVLCFDAAKFKYSAWKLKGRLKQCRLIADLVSFSL
jgi:hypothetical protein